MLRQGGSTISQQLVRAHFLRNLMDGEDSNELRPGALSYVIGARSAKKLVRKLEEICLSVWMEQQMQERFGSKRRAKEEILARYASFLYMGDGQYGFAAAAEYYFGRPLVSFTVADADKAAQLAGIAKSPRVCAPSAQNVERILGTLAEMIGTTRSRVGYFMNRFRKMGLIDYNGSLQVHRTLLHLPSPSVNRNPTATPGSARSSTTNSRGLLTWGSRRDVQF